MKNQCFQALDGPHESVRLSEDHRVYAVGDIHGRVDLLRELLEMVKEDMATRPKLQNTIVFLGDYIDRGPDSAAVIDYLSEFSVSDVECILLMGNHEKYMIDLVTGTVPIDLWLRNGGIATLKSYGIELNTPENFNDIGVLQSEMKKKVPEHHWDFLNNLRTSWQLDGIFFAHAGINPTRPLRQQNDQDLIWIREKFLNSERDHGALIVHGHTPHQEPEFLRNRINVDTLAWQSNHLTTVALENGQCRFLST